MGYKSHSVEKLGEPFLFTDEMVFLLPKGGQLTITKDQFKLLFILKGEVLHSLDDMTAPRLLKEGDILVCPGFHTHHYINPDPKQVNRLHTLRIFMDGKTIRDRASKRVRRPEFDLVDFVYHHFNKTVQCEAGIDGHITECLNALRRETEARDIGNRHRVRSLCTDLVVAVARLLGATRNKNRPQNVTGPNFIVTAAKEYILKSLESRLTLGEIAWHTGKGEEYLARLFKRETGQSVFDYVREMRINQAKTYLLDASLSLTQVAAMCGFSSLSFFSRTFRDIVGMPPSHYRQHIEAAVIPAPPPSKLHMPD